MHRFFLLLFLTPCLSAADSLPEETVVHRTPEKGTVISGSCLLGTSWLISSASGILTAASSSAATGAYWFVVPVIGPLVGWGQLGGPWASGYVLVPLGISVAQALGVFLIIKGEWFPRPVVVTPGYGGNGAGINISIKF